MVGSVPGQEVLLSASSAPRGIPTDTAVALIAVRTERGPVDTPVLLNRLDDYTAVFGGRLTDSLGYDWVETAFQCGVAEIWLLRRAGAAKTKGTRTSNDGAGTPLPTVRFDASSVGPWSANVAKQVIAGSSGNLRTLVIFENGVEKSRYTDLASPAAFQTATASDARINAFDLVSGTAAPNNMPAIDATPVSLTAGTDDAAGVTDANLPAALALLGKELGPGQVAVPGSTTPAAHAAIEAHCAATNRVPLLDPPDLSTVSGLLTLRSQAAANPGNERAGLFAPWLAVQGLVPGTTRVVPLSAGVAGLIARQDATGRPGAPAARAGVFPDFVVGLSGPGFTEVDRATLHSAGVSVARSTAAEGTQLYGFRTVSDDPRWYELTAVRTFMSIVASHGAILEAYVEKPISPEVLSDLEADLRADLAARYDAGFLNRDLPESQAYNVDVGPTVNTDATKRLRQLHSRSEAAPFRSAERVIANVVNTNA